MYKLIISRINTEDGKLPEWMLLFADGWIEVEDEGRIFVDQKGFDMVAKAFERRGNDLVFDYEHQTLKDVKAPAAGWIKGLRYTQGAGIEARVEWTPEAAGYIENKEYRYFSPVFMYRKTDRRIAAVHSVALTNAPKTNHLKPLLAKLGEETQRKEQKMDFFKKLFAALGLADGASEEDVLTAVAKINKKAKDPKVKEVVAKEVLVALDMDKGDASAVVASIHALRQKDKNMVSREEFTKLQDKLKQKDAEEVVAKALAEGKITPDQKDWAAEYAVRDTEGFKTFVAKAPVVVPVEKLPTKEKKIDDITTDETVLAVAKQMNVSEEDIKKYAA